MGADHPVTTVSAASLESVRLFPLPDTVLFPGTMLPLHVFEPRYRAMVADAMGGDRLVAIALLKPGYEAEYEGTPAIHDVVGIGQIVHVQRVRDGRYYLALQGLCRARITTELPTDKPWRIARTQHMPDVLPDEGEQALEDQLMVLRGCLVRLVARMPQRAQALTEILENLKSPALLADVLCAVALEKPDDRQRALGITSVSERIALATEAIADLLLRTDGDEPSRSVLM